MGVTDSKILAEAVSRACFDAETLGENDITAVLTNQEVLDLLHKLWSNLPATAKGKIDPGIAKRMISDGTENNSPRKTRKLKKCVDTKFTLRPDFMAKVPVWAENPLSFFSEDESYLELKNFPLDEMNAYMKKLTEHTGLNTLRLRLLKVMYYRLSGWVGWTQMLRQRPEHMARITSNSEVSALVSEGKRIDNLCRDIGCAEQVQRPDQYFHLGNLFYSLQDVADYWIKESPMKGDARSEAIARLKRRNDLSLAEDRKKLDILAHKLMNTIWSAFQDAESCLESEPHQTGVILREDPQPPTHSANSQQQGRTPEAFVGTIFPDSSTEVATLDWGHRSFGQNLQHTLLQTTLDGSVASDGTRPGPRSSSHFEARWVNGPESFPSTERPASFRPSSLSDFTDTTASSLHDARPEFLASTSLCPTSVSDFFPLNFPPSVQNTNVRSYHTSSISPSSISDFTRAPLSTGDISLGAMSLYPTSFSDFTTTTPTTQSLQPDICSDFTHTESHAIGQNSSLEGLNADPSLHVPRSDRRLTPVTPRISEQSTALTNMAPQQIVSI